MLKGDPLDEPAIKVVGNPVPAGGGIPVQSRPANDQPLRIAI